MHRAAIALGTGLSIAVLGFAEPAAACGGFFCSNISQPVAQAGEQIAFSIEEDGTVTAVIRITWSGPAESFAWIVPVPQVPEIATGSDAIFDALWNATAVTFTTNPFAFRVEGTCHQPQCEEPP